jgi:DNA-binding transcriptional MerR regulator
VNDPLETLRAYRPFAPWNLKDLTTTASAILRAAGVRPINPAAAAAPNQRSIRFYIARGLVAPPAGRGTAAVYSYRHLLQILGVKLRQMEGATLDVITREMGEMTGDVLERRVAAALGPSLLTPDQVGGAGAGRAFYARANRVDLVDDEITSTPRSGSRWRRVSVGPEVELQLRDSHPLADSATDQQIADAIRAALQRIDTHRADAG